MNVFFIDILTFSILYYSNFFSSKLDGNMNVDFKIDKVITHRSSLEGNSYFLNLMVQAFKNNQSINLLKNVVSAILTMKLNYFQIHLK